MAQTKEQLIKKRERIFKKINIDKYLKVLQEEFDDISISRENTVLGDNRYRTRYEISRKGEMLKLYIDVIYEDTISENRYAYHIYRGFSNNIFYDIITHNRGLLKCIVWFFLRRKINKIHSDMLNKEINNELSKEKL